MDLKKQNVGYVIETVCKNTGLSEEEVKKMTFEELLNLQKIVVMKICAEIDIEYKVKELRKEK